MYRISKFKVTTKTIFFEEHIVNADNHAEAKTKAFENIEETSYVGWEGDITAISNEELQQKLKERAEQWNE